jgi:putative transcriptional regulator
MRKSIAKSITNTIKNLNKSGLVDDITMKNIENLCIPEVQEYTPEKIISIRKKFRLSQADLASIFNISPSTVQKWEQGNKKTNRCITEIIGYYGEKRNKRTYLILA